MPLPPYGPNTDKVVPPASAAPVPRQPSRPAVAGPYDNADGADILDFTDSYMSTVHDPDTLLYRAKHYLSGVEYDTLVGTGLSGTIAVTELARKLGKHYLIVRKPNDGTHSYYPVEGRLGKRWVFVDDLVGTGETFSRVWDTIHDLIEDRSFATEYVGAMLYTDMEFVAPTNRRTRSWLRKSEKYDGRYGEPAEMAWCSSPLRKYRT